MWGGNCLSPVPQWFDPKTLQWEALHGLNHEMDQIIFGNPIPQIGWQQHWRLTVYRNKACPHGFNLLTFSDLFKVRQAPSNKPIFQPLEAPVQSRPEPITRKPVFGLNWSRQGRMGRASSPSAPPVRKAVSPSHRTAVRAGGSESLLFFPFNTDFWTTFHGMEDGCC